MDDAALSAGYCSRNETSCYGANPSVLKQREGLNSRDALRYQETGEVESRGVE